MAIPHGFPVKMRFVLKNLNFPTYLLTSGLRKEYFEPLAMYDFLYPKKLEQIG